MLALPLALISTLQAATLSVGSAATYSAIQDAIDDAADGDTIEVDTGTYAEALDLDGKNITVIAIDSASRVIISSPSSDPAVTVDDGETSLTIEGFTIENTNGGQAIRIIDADPVFIGCIVEASGGSSAVYGGAAYVDGGGPSFEGLELADNQGTYGGDFYVTGGAEVIISDTVIDASQATAGGSIFVTEAAVYLYDVEASDSFSDNSGGFAYLDDAEFYAENLILVDPTGDNCYGAGIYATANSQLDWSGGGVSGAEATYASSGYTGGALHLRSSSDLLATDLVFDSNSAYSGGAVQLQDSSTASFSACSFTDNEAQIQGGALHVTDESEASCDGCSFDGNEAEEGGGVSVNDYSSWTDSDGLYESNTASADDGGAIQVTDYGAIELSAASFNGNEAQSGGALSLYNPDGDVVVDSCSFESNVATTGNGGAIAVTRRTDLYINDSSFDINEASVGSGGAISFGPATDGYTLEIADCSFEGNNANDEGGALHSDGASSLSVLDTALLTNSANGGGAIYLEDSEDITLRRNLLHENSAVDSGGAVLQTGSGSTTELTNCIFSENIAVLGAGLALTDLDIQPEVENNNFTGNDASSYGAALYLDSATVSFVNNIVFQGQDGGGLYAADSDSASDSDFYYNDVSDNSGGDYTGQLSDPVGTSGNISEDPELQNYTLDGDESNDDHHLELTSPCLDTGDPALTDLDGSRSDMGVYGGPHADGTDSDGDGYWDITDCDDMDADIYPGADETPYDGIDQDCDGADLTDADGDGYDASEVGGSDCDDEEASTYPGAPDTWYDGVDSDCAGDDDYDQDADGYRAIGYEGGTDCDDTDGGVHPGAPETWYDGTDQDCDGHSDYDQDYDGRDAQAYGGDDCDDTDASVYPGAGETPYDDIDQDCDGYDQRDVDGDGYDAEEAGGTDCDDYDPAIHPGAKDELYDGVDSNCDDAPEYDWDGDGFNSSDYKQDGKRGTDCNDKDASIHPGATEIWYDGVDQNCDGHSDYDQDLDGWDSDQYGGDDCDDTHADAHPGASEVWYDGIDQACDGGDDYDQDGDGWPWSEYQGEDTDCDDLDAITHPEAEELLDGKDNDCDGWTELDDRDADGIADWWEWAMGTDYEDPDSDDDGWLDGQENPTPVYLHDSDVDGIMDALDPDDDGDGIPTLTEQTTDVDKDLVWDVDVDDDGVPNGLDLDSDGDSYLDEDEGTLDRDRDGKPDYLDYTGDYAGGGCALLGGGCNGGNSSLAGLLFLGALFGRCRRERLLQVLRSGAPLLALALLALGADRAHAEEDDVDQMDVRGFWVADTSGDPQRSLRLAYPSSGTGWDTGLVVDVAANPLVELMPDGAEPVVDVMTSAHAFGGVSWRGMRFDAALPVTLYGHDLEGGFAALGDFRAGMHVPALAPRGARPGLGVAAFGWLPTGQASRWSGSPGAALGAVATLAQELGPFGWTLNAGVRLARADDVRNLTTGPGPLGGLDLHYSITDALAMGVGAVLQGAAGFTSWPLEADARLRYRVRGGGFALAGVATGLTQGVGSSAVRGYAGVGYGRRRSDWSPSIIEAPSPTIVQNLQLVPEDFPLPSEQPMAVLKEDRIVVNEQIFFREARAVILPESEGVLTAVRDVLQQQPEVQHLLVEGHTNSRGSDEYNERLSEERAQAVADWLQRHGIEEGRLLAKGFGEVRPLLDDSHPDAMVVNRRVEFIVLRADEEPDDVRIPKEDDVPDEAWEDR